MFFLQLPKMLPGIAQSADSEVPEHQNKGTQNLTTLDSLPQGLIGKMLVYKSGAVKMKIGNAIYNVSVTQHGPVFVGFIIELGVDTADREVRM